MNTNLKIVENLFNFCQSENIIFIKDFNLNLYIKNPGEKNNMILWRVKNIECKFKNWNKITIQLEIFSKLERDNGNNHQILYSKISDFLKSKNILPKFQEISKKDNDLNILQTSIDLTIDCFDNLNNVII